MNIEVSSGQSSVHSLLTGASLGTDLAEAAEETGMSEGVEMPPSVPSPSVCSSWTTAGVGGESCSHSGMAGSSGERNSMGSSKSTSCMDCGIIGDASATGVTRPNMSSQLRTGTKRGGEGDLAGANSTSLMGDSGRGESRGDGDRGEGRRTRDTDSLKPVKTMGSGLGCSKRLNGLRLRR